jgi:hypothetical protein
MPETTAPLASVADTLASTPRQAALMLVSMAENGLVMWPD